MPSIWFDVWLAAGWLVRLGMPPVVVLRKQRPVTCLAWVAVIFLQPWVGLILYLLFGENFLGRRRTRQYAAHADRMLATTRDDPRLQDNVIRPAILPDDATMVHVAERLGGMPILAGNSIELISEIEDLVDHLIAEIDDARDHVHLLYYIFDADYVGGRVIEALIRATGRGVRCRLLVDGVGSRRILREMTNPLRLRGIEVFALLPVNFLRRGLARIDLRNHRKIAVIDGRIGYTGSHNIIRPDYGKRNVGAYRDLTARINGPSVGHLQTVSIEDWSFETGRDPEATDLFPSPSPPGPVAIQSVPSGPNFPTAVVQDVLVEALYKARHRVTMTTPYFIPDEPLFTALRLAALRDIEVRLILPAHSDHRLVDYAARFYFEQLLNAGVRVHLHQDGMLHAKTMTVDDTFALLGSANFDIRSFYLNFEFNLLLYDRDVVDQLRRKQMCYLTNSFELNRDDLRRRTRTTKLACNCAKLLSPLL